MVFSEGQSRQMMFSSAVAYGEQGDQHCMARWPMDRNSQHLEHKGLSKNNMAILALLFLNRP